MQKTLFLIAICSLCFLLANCKTSFNTGLNYYQDGDYKSAYKEISTLAEDKKDANAQFMLGRMYQLGQYVKKNDERAAYWYYQAAMQDNTCAKVSLGSFLWDRGDYQNSYYWSKEASLDGNPLAVANLANFYRFGRIVPKDLKKAENLYLLALEYGDAASALNLGELYIMEKGFSVEQRINGFKWITILKILADNNKLWPDISNYVIQEYDDFANRISANESNIAVNKAKVWLKMNPEYFNSPSNKFAKCFDETME